MKQADRQAQISFHSDSSQWVFSMKNTRLWEPLLCFVSYHNVLPDNMSFWFRCFVLLPGQLSSTSVECGGGS